MCHVLRRSGLLPPGYGGAKLHILRVSPAFDPSRTFSHTREASQGGCILGDERIDVLPIAVERSRVEIAFYLEMQVMTNSF